MPLPRWPENLTPRRLPTCGWCGIATTSPNRVCTSTICRDAERMHQSRQESRARKETA